MRDQLLRRFIRYVRQDTTSNSDSAKFPSTDSQLLLLKSLADELSYIGCTEVEMDNYGYVTATIEASTGCDGEPTIGLLAHVDTSEEMSGENVNVQIVENYDSSKPLQLGDGEYYLTREDFVELPLFDGHTLLTSDGTTLLGADDKAGVAEIVTAAHYIIEHEEIKHCRIRIAFTADEEIGRGVNHFDVEKFGADFAYTIDSGGEGCIEYENFNAARAIVKAKGRNFHPGYAKGKMTSALQTVIAVHNELPTDERPETTEHREGFFHLMELGGGVESAKAEYLIREHDTVKFQERKELLEKAAEKHNAQLEIRDEYLNMRPIIELNMKIVERAVRAIEKSGATPLITPIRGGTDGARLSYMGLPCPNIFTGGMNPHSRFEYASLDSMLKAVHTIINLVQV